MAVNIVQFIEINVGQSTKGRARCSAPQGSILDPLLSST